MAWGPLAGAMAPSAPPSNVPNPWAEIAVGVLILFAGLITLAISLRYRRRLEREMGIGEIYRLSAQEVRLVGSWWGWAPIRPSGWFWVEFELPDGGVVRLDSRRDAEDLLRILRKCEADGRLANEADLRKLLRMWDDSSGKWVLKFRPARPIVVAASDSQPGRVAPQDLVRK